jgi:hypothetical protein
MLLGSVKKWPPIIGLTAFQLLGSFACNINLSGYLVSHIPESDRQCESCLRWGILVSS